MSRTKDMTCVICGKKAHETGSAIMEIRPIGKRTRALAHMDCYGQGEAERRWAEWLCAHAAGGDVADNAPEHPVPEYLAALVEKARAGT